MRLKDNGDSLTVWISADETREWAKRWPCSTLRGKRIVACFDTNGLCDLAVNGRSGVDIDEHEFNAYEFNALTSDFLAQRLKPDHALYFITIGQFQG